MYKNPLNNGDISDYNSLKKQRDYGAIIKKYQNKKLETEPNELQKYYQYLTYQQSILDEINYIAERIKNENIQKQKEDFNFIEDLKIKREEEMKKKAQFEKDIKQIAESLFDNSSLKKNDDITPTILTDNEFNGFEVVREGFGNNKKQKAKISESILSEVETQQEQKPKKNGKGGRPKGSKNTPKKTLDLTK